jgi:tetratricopeptide (TPR) repeat protein
MLADAFTNLVAERSCGLFTVLGMAGVGKSRLAAEFLRGADARVVTGTCLSYGHGITYWPVVSMVKQLLDPLHGCPAAARLMDGDAKVAAAISVLLGEQEAVTSPAEIAWAVRKLFESSAELRPLLVVVDDLHWGEAALFDLVEHVADFSRGTPTLILCLARPELLDARPGWGGGKLNATTLLLEPLQPAETATLIDELLPAGSGFGPRLRERVQVTAGGNPLFVEELLALLAEPGGVGQAVPATIAALLAARLDQLAPAERTVLECGSVEGQSFHQGPVQVMAPQERDVPGRLMALVHKDLVRPDRAVLPGEEAFRFRHLLIRDAAYQALAKADRAELHGRFGRWLEERGAGLVELDEITGYHLEQAYRYRAELGPADGQDRRLAADAAAHLEAAARRAMDRGDTGAAVNLLERAEALLPGQQRNLAGQQSLIWALAQSGRLDDAIARAARIAGECAAAGDRVGELRARLAGGIWRMTTDPDSWLAGLRALVEEARPSIERDGDAAARAVLAYAAGEIDYVRGQNAAAFTAFTQAMGHARQAGELWFESGIRGMAAQAMAIGPTPRAEALRWLEDAEAQSTLYQPGLVANRACILAELGRFDEARLLLTELVPQMNDRGLRLFAATLGEVTWFIEMLDGDQAAAERALRKSCEQLDELGERAFLSTQSCELAEALYALGRYEESEQWTLRGLELGSNDDWATQVTGLRVRAKLFARKGEASAALALAQQADSLARTTDSPMGQGDAALSLAEVMYLTGDRIKATQTAQRAIKCYQRNGAPAHVARAQRLTATWHSGSSRAPG